jgi:chloramphenicol 3-O-phosphotransferase
MEKRAPAYAQADIVLDTSSSSIDEVAGRIVDRLREFGLNL